MKPIEKTKTADFWILDKEKKTLEANEPRIAKLGMNLETGEMAFKTWGLPRLPIKDVNDLFITQSQYNRYGIIDSSEAMFNDNPSEQLVEKVLNPKPGLKAFTYSFRDREQFEDLKDLKPYGYKVPLMARDWIENRTGLVLIDNSHFGRVFAESWWHARTIDAETVYNSYDKITTPGSGLGRALLYPLTRVNIILIFCLP